MVRKSVSLGTRRYRYDATRMVFMKFSNKIQLPRYYKLRGRGSASVRLSLRSGCNNTYKLAFE